MSNLKEFIKMKHLVVCSSFLADPSWRIMVDEAITSAANGNDVTVVYCAGGCRVCGNNPSGSRIACGFCQHYQKRYLKKLLPTATLIPLKRKRLRKTEERQFSYASLNDIKNIIYRDVNLGYGVLSSYITWTRELIEDFTPAKRTYMDFLLREGVHMVDRAYEIVNAVNPDCISLYNGRMLEVRPFLDIAHLQSIEMRGNEIVLTQDEDGSQVYLRIRYPNCLPHDVDENARIAERLWAMENKSLEEKRNIAKSFYEKRRRGIPAGDAWNPGQSRTFISGQSKGLMPENWDANKKNIVIFNSSEDEYSSIDPKFDSLSLFPSQFEGVSRICELLKNRDDYHIYLRVHPNLQKINFPYHTNLYTLPQQFPNLTVLPATSKHSTYDLMDAADKVVVFGSTMGAEAAYWGKSVILIAASLYFRLGFCRTPKTESELLADLTDKPFGCPQNENILKYGYYLVSREYYSERTENLKVAFTKKSLAGHSYWVPTFPKLLGSWALTKFIRSKGINYLLQRLHMSRVPIKLYHD